MKFLKSQWPNIIFGLAALALAIINMVQDNDLMAVAWTLSSVVWLIMAHVNYNEERIKALEKEVEQLKDRAITDVDAKDFPKIHFRHGLSNKKEEK